MKYVNNIIQYEVGDWVALLTGPKYENVQAIVQLTKVTDNNITYEPYNSHSIGCWGNWKNYPSTRPATQEEIDETIKKQKKEIKIGEHKIMFTITPSGCPYIYVGCQKVTKEEFLEVGKEAKWLPSS